MRHTEADLPEQREPTQTSPHFRQRPREAGGGASASPPLAEDRVHDIRLRRAPGLPGAMKRVGSIVASYGPLGLTALMLRAGEIEPVDVRTRTLR